MIDNLGKLDPRARLFTYNAKSKYTNIPTEHSLEVKSRYPKDNQFNYDQHHAPTPIEALEIVMRTT